MELYLAAFSRQEPWSGVSNAIPDATWRWIRWQRTSTWAHWERMGFSMGPKSLGSKQFDQYISVVWQNSCWKYGSFNLICTRWKLKHAGLWWEHMHHAIILGRSISSRESVSVFILGFISKFVCKCFQCLFVATCFRKAGIPKCTALQWMFFLYSGILQWCGNIREPKYPKIFSMAPPGKIGNCEQLFVPNLVLQILDT